MSERKVYEFSNDGNSVIINDSNPPRYWYNYLWSKQGYCAQISQIGHGKSEYINEKADVCQINNRQARYVYIRDDERNSFWNIGVGPTLEPVENYSCEHNIGYTLLKSEKNEIAASWRLFVPYDGYNEIWTIKLQNNSSERRQLSIFSLTSFELEGFSYPRYYEMYRSCETEFSEQLNGVYCESRHPFAPHKRYNAYLASSLHIYAYDGNLDSFNGSIGSFQRPETIISGNDCSNSTTTNFTLGAVLQNKVALLPGESVEMQIVFGVSENMEEAVQIAEIYADKGKVEAALESTCLYYKEKYKTLSVECQDAKINNIMNNWVKKQADFCIVGKKGVRDNLQIAVALLMYRQDKAQEEIIEVLRHQFRDGHAVLTWYPYDDTRYSDQPFWIVWAVIELIKETGDYSILNTEVEYQDGGKGTVLEHIKAAINRLLEDKGPHGLTKIWFADWNDALNVTTDSEAESVMLSAQLCLVLKEMSLLMQRIGDQAYSLYLTNQYESMRGLINKVAWDGEWYVRALSKYEKIGSKESQGSKIYLNSQVWAILAGIPEDDQLSLVVKSIDDMEHPFGFPINKPAYPEYSPHVGRMSGMLPGLYENGGVYCHASAFKIFADCKLHRGEQALRTLCKIMPDSKENPSAQSGAEPYVFTNCYSIHPKYYGKSYQSWTTGTSAWTLMGLYQGMLGLYRDYDGLKIDPCLPPQWEKVVVEREFRGVHYRITINNPQKLSKGKLKIAVDGMKLKDNILPLFDDKEIHEVKVLIY